MNKKGSEWTVSKLVSLILLVIVVVLVIVGVSTGALNPLGKKLKDIFNSVLAFFGKKETGGGGGTNIISRDVNIPGVGKGNLSMNYDDEWCMIVLDTSNQLQGTYKLNFDQQSNPCLEFQSSIYFVEFEPKLEVFSNIYFITDNVYGKWKWSTDLVTWREDYYVTPGWKNEPQYRNYIVSPILKDIIADLKGKNYETGKEYLQNIRKAKMYYDFYCLDPIFLPDDSSLRFQSEVRSSLLTASKNMNLDFEGGKKMYLDSYAGLAAGTSGGTYAFGRDYSGEDSSSSVYLLKYHLAETREEGGWTPKEAGWDEITKGDIQAMPDGNDKNWKWNLYKAFNSVMNDKEKSKMWISVGGQKKYLNFRYGGRS